MQLISGERIIQSSITKRPEALAGFTKMPTISALTNQGRVLLRETCDWEDITPDFTDAEEEVIHISVCEDREVIVLVTTNYGRLLEFCRNRRWQSSPPKWEEIKTPSAEQDLQSCVL